jgi:DNA-binding GntR family transcriptional regulator
MVFDASSIPPGVAAIPVEPRRPIPLRNLQQQAYEMLLERILRAEPGYEPGSRLNVPSLAAELGVSLTPVKDSLRMLQAYSLVEMAPRRGTFIASLSAAEFDQHIDVLRELEFAALRLSNGHVSPEKLGALRKDVERARQSLEVQDVLRVVRGNQSFHESLVGLADNDQLLKLYCSPRGYLLSTVYGPRDRDEELHLIAEHEAIVDALEHGAMDSARQRIASHWEHTRRVGHAALEALQERRRQREQPTQPERAGP